MREFLVLIILWFTQVQANSLIDQYRSPEGTSDACYIKETVREATECVLDAIESYLYVPSCKQETWYTTQCPYLATHIALHKCSVHGMTQ